MIQLKNASENFKFNVNFYSLKIGELYSSLVKDNLKFKKNNLHLFISKSLKYSFFYNLLFSIFKKIQFYIQFGLISSEK